MPKIVDHDRRRAQLAEAVWRVVGRAGVEGASVRAVAAEAGWSMGSLRYYFSTQDDLLLFALETMETAVVARARSHYADPGPGAPSGGLDRACRLIEELLPLDEQRRVEALVWLAFTARAAVDPAFDAARRAGWDGTRHLARLALADTLGLPLPSTLGTTLPTAALEADAADLHVTIDGWSLQAAAHPHHWPPTTLSTAVRDRLTAARNRHAPVGGAPS